MEQGVALVSVRALEDVLDGCCVEELQQFGLVDGAFYGAAREDGGEVKQRAGDARAGHGVDRVDVSGEERGAGVVDGGSFASSASR
jgi:hypothetical protein